MPAGLTPRPEAPEGEPGCGAFQTARDSRNLRRVHAWLLAVSLTYMGATAALRWRASVPVLLPWLLAGLALVVASQATRSYLAFLRGADELLRSIQMEALALGFGAGVATSLFYPLLEGLGAPAFGEHVTAVVMMLCWGLRCWLGARRYSAGVP